jgi:hypothetical protein
VARQDQSAFEQTRDRLQIAARFIGELLQQWSDIDLGWRGKHQDMVVVGTHHVFSGDIAAGANAILDDEGVWVHAAELLAGDASRGVGDPSCAIRDNDFDNASRPIRGTRGCCSEGHCSCEKRSAIDHGLYPALIFGRFLEGISGSQ